MVLCLNQLMSCVAGLKWRSRSLDCFSARDMRSFIVMKLLVDTRLWKEPVVSYAQIECVFRKCIESPL
jgi:hypothetical protein